MAPKRNELLDDSDLDSNSSCADSDDSHIQFQDKDLQDEHSLFDDPYSSKRNKRRRMNNGKADAIYGVFATDADHQLTNSKKPDKRLHCTPAFVQASSSSATRSDQLPKDQEDQPSENSSADDDSASDSSDSSDSTQEEPGDPNPASLSENLNAGSESRPRPSTSASNDDFRAMLGAGGGLGSRGLNSEAGNRSSSTTTARQGLGSRPSDGNANNESSTPVDRNSAEPALPRRSFLGAQQSNPSIQPVKKKPLSKAEQQHFAKLASDKTSSIGLKMLEKMGWKSGTGLGTQGEGIVTPLETKARPKGMGLSYKGFEERTTQAKEEDRRNGKIIDDDDDDKKQGKKKDKRSQAVREAWKAKPKSLRKPNVVHRTYEQIISELDADQMSIDPGVGEIIDLTGRKLPSLNTTLTDHSKGPTREEQEHRLPELMHNLTLICDISKGNLIHLAKEGQAIKQKSQQLAKDQARSQQILNLQQQKLSKIKRIVELTQLTRMTYSEILNQITENSTAAEICQMIDQFDGLFDQLLEFLSDNQSSGHESLRLDEIVVSALAPILRQVWSRWDVLQQPSLSVKELKRFRRCFRTDKNSESSTSPEEDDQFQHPLFPTSSRDSRLHSSNRKMTAYESLIWNDWLPKIRSAVNLWSPYQSEQMIAMYTSWKSMLPQFVHDNFLDQLIVPKLLTWIGNWDFREQSEGFESSRPNSKRVSLHLFVFPWLELVGPYRSELILAEVKLKLLAWLKAWKYTSVESDEESLMIQDLLVWKKDVLKRRDWDKMMLKTVAPHLASYLRGNLTINPKNQILRPFQVMMEWSQLITNHEMLNELLIKEFFSKWIETLWIWLTSPSANGEQIGAWYQWWKSLFPERLLTEQRSMVSRGFAAGQELMNQAKSLSSLGQDLKTQLPKPDVAALAVMSGRSRGKSTGHKASAESSGRLKTWGGKRLEEITFKSIVEEEVLKNNLFLIPLGKSLDSNGRSLFKVDNQFNTHASSGLLISIDDDVVFVKNPTHPGNPASQNDDPWEPMLLDDMLKKALLLVNHSSS